MHTGREEYVIYTQAISFQKTGQYLIMKSELKNMINELQRKSTIMQETYFHKDHITPRSRRG